MSSEKKDRNPCKSAVFRAATLDPLNPFDGVDTSKVFAWWSSFLFGFKQEVSKILASDESDNVCPVTSPDLHLAGFCHADEY